MTTATALETATAWGPIGREVYERTYSRPKPDGGMETWPETVRRVVAGNLDLAPRWAIEPGEREKLERLIESFGAIPAGRHLWASGAQTSLGLFNCHRAGWEQSLSSHFAFAFDQQMLGGGVGANYSAEYLHRLPVVSNKVTLDIRISETHPDYAEVSPMLPAARILGGSDLLVGDSREGWVEALRLVIEAHTVSANGATLSLVLDVSEVRCRGSRIHGFGGTASGPGPLVEMLQNVNRVLNERAGKRLGPLDAMAVDHEIARCVISGNVRRSARMSILHWDDPDIFRFIECKTDPSAHWSTNISVEVDDAYFTALNAGNLHALKVLDMVAEGMYKNGEPGLFNSSLASKGERLDVRSTNPCGEIALEEWEQCCLGHVNLAAYADDKLGALEAFRLMARYLVRATLSRSSSSRQEAIKTLNRRIGVGFFGFHDWALLKGVPFEEIPESLDLLTDLEDFKAAVDAEAAWYANELGIAEPIKTTTVAPTGSIAKLPGVSEGIQPPFSPYFIRRVRYASSDPKVLELLAQGYHVEEDMYSPNTAVVSFPCRDEIVDKVDPALLKGSNEIPVEAYLRVQAAVQRTYADNAISITVNFDRSSLDLAELKRLIRVYLPQVKGITLMPEDGRPQSPYERISREAYLFDNHNLVGQAMDDCSAGACPIR